MATLAVYETQEIRASFDRKWRDRPWWRLTVRGLSLMCPPVRAFCDSLRAGQELNIAQTREGRVAGSCQDFTLLLWAK
jgi:hypothetical protein